jgi:hypothetical protein
MVAMDAAFSYTFSLTKGDHPLTVFYRNYMQFANNRRAAISDVIITIRHRIVIEYANGERRSFMTHKEALDYIYFTYNLKRDKISPYQPADSGNQVKLEREVRQIETLKQDPIIEELKATGNKKAKPVLKNELTPYEQRRREELIRSTIANFS